MTGTRRTTPTDRRIIGLAIPALGALAVEPLYVLVDTAIVGRLGTTELAGLALAAAVLSFVVAGTNFLTYGTTEQVARRIGADDPAAAADVGVQALWLAVLLGTAAAPLLAVGAPAIAGILGGSGEVIDVAVEYLQIRAIGIPFVLVTLAAQGVLRGVADYRAPLVVLALANLTNVVVELWLVFGLGLGIAGAAWSTVIAQTGAAVVFVVVTRNRLRPATTRRPSMVGMAPLATAGRHLVLRVAAMLVVFGGATAIAARTDAATLAAHQIVMSLFLLLALTLDALAVPAQTLVAEALGRRRRTAARELATRTVRLSVILGVVLAVIVAISSPVLPWVFSPDPEVRTRATVALLVLAVFMVPAAVAFAYDGILIGAGDYRFLGFAAVGYLLAVAPLGAAVLAFEPLGLGSLWLSLGGWMLLRAVVNHRRSSTVLAPR